jgi:hypothetical protein
VLALGCDPKSEPDSAPVPARDSVAEATPQSVSDPVLAAGLPREEPDAADEPEALPPTAEPDPDVRHVARALAGFETTHEDPRYAKLLAHHGPKIDEAWAEIEERFGTPMSTWAGEHLPHEEGTVFYPFSGADFFTVHRFYPEATHYVMVAMQHGRRPISFENLSGATLHEHLKTYRKMAQALAKRGFFVTTAMNHNMGDSGITSELMLIAEREGFDVLDVEPIELTDAGELVVEASERPRWASVRLHMRRRADGYPVTLDYVRANLANRGIEETPGLRPWLDKVAHGPVMAKAASHLMQQSNFTDIRDLLLDRATCIVQDESAIAYQHLAERFEVQLFGEFEGVNELFRDEPQIALAAAYAKGPTQPLPFVFGYDKSVGSALQVARTRR